MERGGLEERGALVERQALEERGALVERDCGLGALDERGMGQDGP